MENSKTTSPIFPELPLIYRAQKQSLQFEVNGETIQKDFNTSARYIGTLPATKLDLNFSVDNSLSNIQGASEIKFNASEKSDISLHWSSILCLKVVIVL